MSAAASNNYCRKVETDTLSLETFDQLLREQHHQNFYAGRTGAAVAATTLEGAEKLTVAYFADRYPSVVRSVMRASSSGGVGTVFFHFVFKGTLPEAEWQARWHSLWEEGGALDNIHQANARKYKRLRKEGDYPLFLTSVPTDIGRDDITFCTAACFFIVGR